MTRRRDRLARALVVAGCLGAAVPVGIAAAAPGVNGAELALWLLTSVLLWAAWPALTKESS